MHKLNMLFILHKKKGIAILAIAFVLLLLALLVSHAINLHNNAIDLYRFWDVLHYDYFAHAFPVDHLWTVRTAAYRHWFLAPILEWMEYWPDETISFVIIVLAVGAWAFYLRRKGAASTS